LATKENQNDGKINNLDFDIFLWILGRSKFRSVLEMKILDFIIHGFASMLIIIIVLLVFKFTKIFSTVEGSIIMFLVIWILTILSMELNKQRK